MLVKKRDGSKEEFSIQKIKKSIAFACEKHGVQPLALESKIDQIWFDGMKTSEIQENIIRHATNIASRDEPQWLNVAGNAFAANEWHNPLFRGKSLKDIVEYNIKMGNYIPTLKSYTDYEYSELDKTLDHSLDLDHSISSLITAKKKYLGKYELNQHMHMVNSMMFAMDEPLETRLDVVRDYYETLSKREFSLATPFLANLRNGGNLASCFILALEDDLDSIFENIHRMAKISKNGGGIGVFLGYLRAKGSWVGKVKNSSGSIVQWIKIINDTMVAVNQEGRRQGAATVALPIWHNDIFDFLDMQHENGDIRLKAYDVFPQITVPDIFMKRSEAGLPWVTFCPHEVKKVLGIDIRGLHLEAFESAYLRIEQAAYDGKLTVFRIIENARTLTKTIMRTQFESGMPYWAFTDTMNRENPNLGDTETDGILCANLCVESYSNIKPDKYGHVCNLGSINLGNIKDFNHLARVSKIACRMLNAGVRLTKHPDQITSAHNQRFRTIGIGVMGLHDYLCREHLSFTNHNVIRQIFECIEFNAASESVELAKKYGTFEAYEHSGWANGAMCKKFAERSTGHYDWMALQEKIDQHGMHNSQLTSPAPTTSTSIYQDASSSVLPVFSSYFIESNKNGDLVVASKFLADNPMGYAKTQSKWKPKELIDVVAVMQEFVDTGISMELSFDHNRPDFNAKELFDAIHHAHKMNLKTIYYIRSVKKNETIACESCSG